MSVRTASVVTIWIGIIYAWLGVVFGPGWRDFATGFAIIGAGWLIYAYAEWCAEQETVRVLLDAADRDQDEEQAA